MPVFSEFVNFHMTTCHRCRKHIPAFDPVELVPVTIGLFEVVCSSCSQIPEKPGEVIIDSPGGVDTASGLEAPHGVVTGPVEDVPGRQAEDLAE